MAKQRFTADRVKNFPHPHNGQVLYWDSVVRGLGVRATPSSKAYIFQARMNGKTIRVKIGDITTWVIDSNAPDIPGARQEARRLQALVDKGIDPRLDKQERLKEQSAKQADASREEITLAEVWPIYTEDRRPHWSERHHDDHIKLTHLGGIKRKRAKGKTKPGALASLMPLRLIDLSPTAVEPWAPNASALRAAQARLAFALLRAFANWCEAQEEYKGFCDLS